MIGRLLCNDIKNHTKKDCKEDSMKQREEKVNQWLAKMEW